MTAALAHPNSSACRRRVTVGRGCRVYSPSVSRCWSGSTSVGRQCSTVLGCRTATLTGRSCASILPLPAMNWTTRSDQQTITHLPTTSSCVSCSTPSAHTTRRRGNTTSSGIPRRHAARRRCRHVRPSVLSATSRRMTAAAAARVVVDVLLMYSIALMTNGLYVHCTVSTIFTFIGRPFIKRFALCYQTVVCLSCPVCL